MRKYILMAAAVAVSLSVSAQRVKNKELDSVYYHCNKGHYVAGQVGYGLQNQTYSFSDMAEGAERNNDLGISFKFGYKYYFTDHLGVGLSAMYQNYQAKTTFNFTSEGAMQQTPYGVDYIPVTVFNNLRERQSLHTLSIPVELMGQFGISKRWKTEIGLGAAYTLAMGHRYKIVDGSIEGEERFPQYNGTLNYDYELHDTYKITDMDGHYDKNSVVSGLAEINFLFSVSRRLEVSVGVMGIYAFGSPSKENNLPIFVNDQDVQQRKYNGVLNTNYVHDNGLASAQLTVGLRYRIFARGQDFETVDQTRRKRETEEFNIQNQRRQEFDKKNRKYNDAEEIDTLADEERRRRIIQDVDIHVDTPADTVAVDTVSQVPDGQVTDLPATVEDPMEAQPEIISQPAEPVKTPEQEVQELLLVINDNSCGFNSSPVSNPAKYNSSIDRLAQILRENPDIHIYIYGHTCDIGTEAQNKIVGQRRADSFKAELVARGVSDSQISTDTKWFTEPLVPNTTPANRARNRRVQLLKAQ